MSKEVKAQEAEKAKNNRKYVALALVIILATIGIMMNNGSEEENKSPTTVATADTSPVKEQATITEEPTIARIDITTPLIDAEKPQFEVYVDGLDTPEKQTYWMPKYNIQGYTIEKEGSSIEFNIKALNNTDIKIILKGPWERDDKGNIIEHWVDYTSLMVNGKEKLFETTSVWHNKPFNYIIEAKKGETINIHTDWKKHKN